jgi:hypothetical protein
MKLTKAIFGVAAGDVYPRTYAPGDECPAELEDAAREAGALEDKTSKKAPEKK